MFADQGVSARVGLRHVAERGPRAGHAAGGRGGRCRQGLGRPRVRVQQLQAESPLQDRLVGHQHLRGKT